MIGGDPCHVDMGRSCGRTDAVDASDRRSAGDVAWLRQEFLVGSRELTRSARERSLLGPASCQRVAMLASKRLRQPLREALREHRNEPADK